MLKKSASIVLASLRDSTYRKDTRRRASSLAAAALDSFFEHPVGQSAIIENVLFTESHQGENSFPATS
jgi:hypothetical protein